MRDALKGRTGKETAPAPVFSHATLGVLLPEPVLDFSAGGAGRLVVVFRSEYIGEGDPQLGGKLMQELLQALLDHPEPPRALLFYNSAVRLTQADSPVCGQLRQLSERGSALLICRSSLQALLPGHQPVVGRTAAFAELTDEMRQARQLLWP